MRRLYLAALFAAGLFGAGQASAAIVTLDFTVNPGSWEQNYGTGSPFGLGDDPTLTGSVTFDDADHSGNTFSYFSYVAGTKTWTVDDINRSLSSLVFDSGIFQDVRIILGPLALGEGGGGDVNSLNIDISGQNNGGDALLGTATTFPPLDGEVGIFCNGCVTFTDTVAGGAVPEPSAWALMIAGFGLAGSALRRRRVLA